jgi:transcription elongation factor Elf1
MTGTLCDCIEDAFKPIIMTDEHVVLQCDICKNKVLFDFIELVKLTDGNNDYVDDLMDRAKKYKADNE